MYQLRFQMMYQRSFASLLLTNRNESPRLGDTISENDDQTLT
jgi:hypothetical protein